MTLCSCHGSLSAGLSADCRVVACQVHEGFMCSAAYGYQRGSRVSELARNVRQGMALSVFGSPPPSFQSIRERLMREQDASVGGRVDYIFDMPVEVAAAVCNYRNDRWGMARFTRLVAR